MRAGSGISDRALSGGSVRPQPRMAGMRRAYDQTSTPKPHSGLQSEGALGRDQRPGAPSFRSLIAEGWETSKRCLSLPSSSHLARLIDAKIDQKNTFKYHRTAYFYFFLDLRTYSSRISIGLQPIKIAPFLRRNSSTSRPTFFSAICAPSLPMSHPHFRPLTR